MLWRPLNTLITNKKTASAIITALRRGRVALSKLSLPCLDLDQSQEPSRPFRQPRGDDVIGALGENETNHRQGFDPEQAVISGLKLDDQDPRPSA